MAWLDEAGTDCPDLLSIAQIIRTAGVLTLIAAAAGGFRFWALLHAAS
jgi:hypothetical protein